MLVQSSFANVYLTNAIFGLASAVAVPLGDDIVMGGVYHRGNDRSHRPHELEHTQQIVTDASTLATFIK